MRLFVLNGLNPPVIFLRLAVCLSICFILNWSFSVLLIFFFFWVLYGIYKKEVNSRVLSKTRIPWTYHLCAKILELGLAIPARPLKSEILDKVLFFVNVIKLCSHDTREPQC